MRKVLATGLLATFSLLSTAVQAGPACSGNYLLEKTFASGGQWQLCWEHRQREGIVYHDIFYTPPGGTERRILNQANIAQIHVPYDDNGARFHDVSDYGLGGNNLNDLQTDDCPGGTFKGENGKNMVCLKTQERNHAHAHHVGSSDTHKIGEFFEVFSVTHVGAYNYIPAWKFYDDGTIEVAMGATGSLQRFRTGSQHASSGWLLNSTDKYGVSHLHNYYWRLDFDLGTNENDDVVEEIEFINQAGNISRNKLISPFNTEVARSIAPDSYRSWRIRDGANTNASGHAISYQIEPLLTGHRDTGPFYEPWTDNDFYVTVNNSCEIYASHNPQVNGCADNLSEFVNGQSLVNADLIVWYGMTFHHIPRDEDEPKMHAHWNSFKIIPRNVTVSNPLADSPGSGNTTVIFEDDFETDKGWTPNPQNTDTATTGMWERGNPEPTSSNGPKQLGNTVSGTQDLVTGATVGSSVDTNDIDNGVTSIRSPDISIPAGGPFTLSFNYYMAHTSNSSTEDFFKVSVVGSSTTVVLEELGATNDDDGSWLNSSTNIDAFAGQTVYLLIEAADNSGDSIVEAGVDDIKIEGVCADTDTDGLDDCFEQQIGTNPALVDTDGDGISDFAEVDYDTDASIYNPYHPTNNPGGTDLDANNQDTDGDGFSDSAEITAGTDPLDMNDVPVIPDGDLNIDGAVNAADVLIASRIISGQLTITAQQLSHGDVAPLVAGQPTPDGVFNLGDLIVIQRKALGLINF